MRLLQVQDFRTRLVVARRSVQCLENAVQSMRRRTPRISDWRRRLKITIHSWNQPKTSTLRPHAVPPGVPRCTIGHSVTTDRQR